MSLLDALSVVVPTPADHRVWIDEPSVLEILRCTPDQLAQLVDSGLAHEEGCYDNFDIWNLGLLSASGRTRPELEMILLARVLRSYQADWVSMRRYTVTGSVECPLGRDCPSPEWRPPALPDVRWTEEKVQTGRAEWRGEAELSGRSALVREPRVREVWNDVTTRYRFQFTPERLASDAARTRERGVGDCEALCHVLMQDLLDLGIPTELQPGYIYGGFRMRRHSWLRITDSDGQVKVLDPSMALLADMFFTPDYKAFCYGSSLNRLVPVRRTEDFVADHPCVPDGDILYDFTLSPRPAVNPGHEDFSASMAETS